MNKPKKTKALKGVKEMGRISKSTTGEDILKATAGAGLAAIGQNIAEKMGGVHNSDLKKQLDWLVEDAKKRDLKMDWLMREVNRLRKELGERQLPFSLWVGN